ncbi:MAG: hypothetical protein IH948_08680, partial [Bacteroidetes bacterium]|nr:hypothetical protein [Bacteroidota bacterium]
ISHVANGDTLRTEEIVNVPVSSSFKEIFRPVIIPSICIEKEKSFAYGKLYYNEAGELKVMFVSGNDSLLKLISGEGLTFNMNRLPTIQESLDALLDLDNSGNISMKFTKMTLKDESGNIQEIVTDKFGFFHLDNIPENAITVLRAHGEPGTTYTKLQEKSILKGKNLNDATCPLVTLVHNVAKKLKNNGYEVILFGKAGH